MDKENPLYLPAGSIRAIIALISISAAVFCICTETQIPEWFIASLAGVIAYFFGSHTPIKP